MTFSEIAVILFGLFAGYWVVSKLFFRPPSSTTPVASPEPAWHKVLGVTAEATAEQIRDAYKHLISKYHPDKVDNLGQELKNLAEHKTQEITAAYREAMRSRGVDP